MPSRLTPRQRECLQLSATLHDQQIADRLGISVHTVRQHIQEARDRLGVQDRKAARGLLPQIEGAEFEGMSSPAEPVPSVAVTAPIGSVRDDEDRGNAGSLYEMYARLGRWREPPRIGGTRLLLIVLWALICIGLVAAVTMLQSIMDTLGRLR